MNKQTLEKKLETYFSQEEFSSEIEFITMNYNDGKKCCCMFNIPYSEGRDYWIESINKKSFEEIRQEILEQIVVDMENMKTTLSEWIRKVGRMI